MLRENLKPATPESFEDLGTQLDAPVLLRQSSFFGRFRSKKFLFSHELGFRIHCGRKQTDILYSSINSLSVDQTEIYSGGFHYGTRYQIRVVYGRLTIQFRYLAPADDRSDIFVAFLRRMIVLLADRFETNKSLRSKEWFLDETGFHWNDGTLDWSEIVYVDLVDHRVCIWKLRETFPVVRLDDSGAQAWILNEILERYTKQHPQQLPSDSLGRHLFSRRANKALLKIVPFLSLALLATGVWLLWMGHAGTLPALLLLFLCGPGGLYLFFALRRTFHFFQRGIIQEPGHRVFFYDGCESLVYDTSLQFINGIYAFTRIQMNLHGSADVMKIKIQCYGNDLEVEQARVEASTRIAERLYQKVATEGEVRWGNWARIGPHEVHHLSARMLGSNLRLTLPFTQPISYAMEAGKFYLFRAGEPNPLFEMDCNEENFYPGLFLLIKLVAEH